MTTTDKIKQIIADEFKMAFEPDKIERFKDKERILASISSEGRIQYLNNRLFDLKKAALESSAYGKNWVAYECFEVDTHEAFDHITKECEFRFVSYLDLMCKYFPKNGYTLENAIDDSFDYINGIVSDFYKIVSEVQPLEQLLLEADKKPFLMTSDIVDIWKYTGEIWDCPDLATLEKVFDFNNTQKQDFKIKRDQDIRFYKILRGLYNKRKRKGDTQERLLKPFIERYGLKWSTFSSKGQKNDIL